MLKRLFILLFCLQTYICYTQISYDTYIDTATFSSGINNMSFKLVAADNGDIAMVADHSASFAYDSLLFVILDQNRNIKVDTSISLAILNSSGYGLTFNDIQYSSIDSSYVVIFESISYDPMSFANSTTILKIDNKGKLKFHKVFKSVGNNYSISLNKIILADDGSIYISGLVQDPNYILNTNATVIKLSSNGSLLWKKVYYHPKYNVSINSLEKISNNKIVFAGGLTAVSYNIDSLNYFVQCVDSAGNFLWNQTYDLDTLPGIGPSEPKKTNLVFNNNNLCLFINVNDTSYIDISLYAKLDTLGNNLQLYKYSSINQGNPFSVNQAVSQGGNMYLLFEDNYYDGLGKYDINNELMLTSAFTSNYNEIHSITPHPGEGVLGIGTDNSFLKNFLFHVDNSLKAHCNDSTISFQINNLTAISESVTLNETSSGFFNDTIPSAFQADEPIQPPLNACGCNITISGIGNYSSNPADSIKLYLYKALTVPNPFHIVDSTVTNLTGNYSFSGLQSANYILKALPVAPKYPDAVRTYYSLPPQWPYWDSATVLTTNCLTSMNLVNIDIDLIQNVASSYTGIGILSGYVYEGNGFNQRMMIPGDPIPGIDITVSVPPPSPPKVVGTTTTDNNGHYQFNNLSLTDTFIVSVDYPGIPNDSVYQIELTLSSPTADSLNFYIDSSSVYILNNGIVTNGEENIKIKIAPGVTIYPNPSSDIIYIHSENVAVKSIEVVDINGRSVYKQINQGNNLNFIDISEWVNGVYFMKITRNNFVGVKKIVVRK